MSKYLNDKLTVLYTLLIVMVVYIHSYYLEGEQYQSTLFLQKFIGSLCRVANCLFFCLLGYLFARSIGNIKDVFAKQRKRFRTSFLHTSFGM